MEALARLRHPKDVAQIARLLLLMDLLTENLVRVNPRLPNSGREVGRGRGRGRVGVGEEKEASPGIGLRRTCGSNCLVTCGSSLSLATHVGTLGLGRPSAASSSPDSSASSESDSSPLSTSIGYCCDATETLESSRFLLSPLDASPPGRVHVVPWVLWW